MRRLVPICILAFIFVGVLAACSFTRGTPDREETFKVADGECTAAWWLEPLVDEVPDEATAVADHALTEATVSTAEREEWKEIVLDSQSGDRQISQSQLEGHAYIEVVREHVRSDLQEAGYPDAPTRIIEVYSDLQCT